MQPVVLEFCGAKASKAQGQDRSWLFTSILASEVTQSAQNCAILCNSVTIESLDDLVRTLLERYPPRRSWLSEEIPRLAASTPPKVC